MSQNELKWAKIVANDINIPLKVINTDPLVSGWSIKEALYQVEDPYLTLPLPMLATYRAIANAGVKVTLDGHGADELLGGYGELNHAFKISNKKETAELVSIMNSLVSGKYISNNNV